MSDDGASDAEGTFATPRSRAVVVASESDREAPESESGGTRASGGGRRRVPETRARLDLESPARVRMDRGSAKIEGARDVARAMPTLAIDAATLRRVFRLVDKDANGTIDAREFLDAWLEDPEVQDLLTLGSDIACADESIAEEEKVRRAQSIFDKMDADESKTLTFAEFKKYFEISNAKTSAELAGGKSTPLNLDAPLDFSLITLERIFDKMDANGDGKVSDAELARARLRDDVDRLRANSRIGASE